MHIWWPTPRHSMRKHLHAHPKQWINQTRDKEPPATKGFVGLVMRRRTPCKYNSHSICAQTIMARLKRIILRDQARKLRGNLLLSPVGIIIKMACAACEIYACEIYVLWCGCSWEFHDINLLRNILSAFFFLLAYLLSQRRRRKPRRLQRELLRRNWRMIFNDQFHCRMHSKCVPMCPLCVPSVLCPYLYDISEQSDIIWHQSKVSLKLKCKHLTHEWFYEYITKEEI